MILVSEDGVNVHEYSDLVMCEEKYALVSDGNQGSGSLEIETIRQLKSYKDIVNNDGSLFVRSKYKSFVGSPVLIAYDALKRRIKNLNIYGNSVQNGTPSPSNPVPIQSIGDNGSLNIRVSGKNLFNGELASDLGKWVTSGTYLYFKISGLNPNIYHTFSNYNYSIFSSITSGIAYLATTSGGSDNIFWHYNVASYRHTKITAKPNSNGEFYLRIHTGNSSLYNSFAQSFRYAQIEEGSIATEFEPFNSLNLYNIPSQAPLRRLPDGTADYVDLERNKIVRNIGFINNWDGSSFLGSDNFLSSTGGLNVGADIIYKLQTPTEEYIIAPQINSLFGQTNISSLNIVAPSKIEADIRTRI